MKKIIIAFIAFLLVACSSNTIYFDLGKKEVISCKGILISSLIVEGLDENIDYYRFSLKENFQGNGVETFSLIKINDAFDIYLNNGSIASGQLFRLKPLSKYKILNNSIGDVSEFSIIVFTDRNGEIINSTKVNCE